MKKVDISKVTTYQAGVVQASMHRLLQKKCDEILRPFGITKMQWLIIGTVLDAGKAGIKTTQLADKLATTLPYLTNSLNLLQSKGIITKKPSPKDNRIKVIKVTPQFAKKCPKIEKTLRDGLRESIYSQVDPADFEVYISVMFELSRLNHTKYAGPKSV